MTSPHDATGEPETVAACFPRRTSGVLLHPTSLPGAGGIGCLGEEARRFVDFLAASGQGLWQVLPLGPTGYADSPYSTFCSVAGNPLLIDLRPLVEAGDLDSADLDSAPPFPQEEVDYGPLTEWKHVLLEKAARRFLANQQSDRFARYRQFCGEHQDWLPHYALFMAVKKQYDLRAAAENRHGATWNNYWDADIALREPAALTRWKEQAAEGIELQQVWQHYFFEQWNSLRRYASSRGVRIVGDMPIFVAGDSSDVWVAPQNYQLDERGRPRRVAGVPPDYFSATGQRWGNPLYDWQVMQAEDFAWWKMRFRRLLGLVDIVRVDHFRGFEASWSIPAKEETAVKGFWEPVPGKELFEALVQELGEMPIIAEDLGVITEAVVALRDHFGFPGMRVLQVGLETIESNGVHLPENFVENCVVYTGTHDNETTVGWFESLSEEKRSAIDEYVGHTVVDPAWELIELAMQSRAVAAVIPMQDLLSLGSQQRMNIPGTVAGNWRWRMSDDYMQGALVERLRRVTHAGGRSG